MVVRKTKDGSWRKFKTEEDARRFALEALKPHFVVYEEVNARGPPDATLYRPDVVTLCPKMGYLLGWEFKRSPLFKAEFVDCLQQAIYHRLATMADPRFDIDGRRLDACIVFPDWHGLHDDGKITYAGEADGMRLLASKYRVGVLSEPLKRDGVSIIIGESGVWHSWSGWTGNAAGVLRGKRPRASQRRLD